MTIFFLLIGLELEREIYKGELSNFKNALLPIFGAIGGLIIPAGFFMLLHVHDHIFRYIFTLRNIFADRYQKVHFYEF